MKKMTGLISCIVCISLMILTNCEDLRIQPKLKEQKPIVLATWYFTDAVQAAWDSIHGAGSTALEAIVVGCTKCEEEQCDGSVGFGGSPDENGESTLDAMIMDGMTMDVGSVGNLRNVKNAIGVAYAVMKYTEHTLLVGSLATQFALSMGFPLSNLSTESSIGIWTNWKNRSCQPNFWKDVIPNPKTSCGPYKPAEKVMYNSNDKLRENHHNGVNTFMQKDEIKDERARFRDGYSKRHNNRDTYSHDTIGMIAVDTWLRLASGTSTNGATHKVPGRVGDSPIVGSGSFADSEIGAATATGDGDVMMRFLPSFHAVELMRFGQSPSSAAADAIARIARHYQNFSGALIAYNINGEYGAACHNLPSGNFPYTVMSPDFDRATVLHVNCI